MSYSSGPSLVRAAGTTHISDWIRANHVDISRNYIREDREGGLDVFGNGFPGIPRQDLMVLPEDEWKAEQPELTYEGRTEKVKKLEAQNAEP